jgi:integrase/recombinase XerC
MRGGRTLPARMGTVAAESLPALPEQATFPAVAQVDLLQAVLSGRAANSFRSYKGDYADFARFVGASSPAVALDQLVILPHGAANATAMAYRADLLHRELAASTVGRRLSALRTAVRVARQLGRVSWSLEVESPRAEAYRDTKGPGRTGWKAMATAARAAATTPTGRRDLAILRLLHDLALRRAEVVSLDLAHVDLDASTLEVLGKGRTQRLRLTLPAPTRAALADWLTVRGTDPGPVFHPVGRGRRPASQIPRLSAESVRSIVARTARAAGLSRVVRPHGLRHQAITAALDATGGDVRAVQRFSRHAKLDTLMVYDDARRDFAGQVASLVANDDD